MRTRKVHRKEEGLDKRRKAAVHRKAEEREHMLEEAHKKVEAHKKGENHKKAAILGLMAEAPAARNEIELVELQAAQQLYSQRRRRKCKYRNSIVQQKTRGPAHIGST